MLSTGMPKAFALSADITACVECLNAEQYAWHSSRIIPWHATVTGCFMHYWRVQSTQAMNQMQQHPEVVDHARLKRSTVQEP